MTDDFQPIIDNIVKGNPKLVRNKVRDALEKNIEAEKIISEGLLEGLGKVSEQFKNGKIYVSELLVAVQAMNAGIDVIERLKPSTVIESKGTIVIGTVKDDLHNIGKNLVSMMFNSAGFEVIDLGVDVEAKTFVDTAIENNADIICLSAMLTTTMPHMKEVIDRLERMRLSKRFTVMVGGAPVTEKYAKQIGADYYSKDAASAASLALEIMKKKKNRSG